MGRLAERHLIRVDRVERAVEEGRLEVDDRVTSERSLLSNIADALLDARPVLARHCATNDARGELDPAARIGLDLEEYLAELAAAAGLLLVPALNRRLAADRLAIRDARRLGDDGGAELALQLLDGDGDL